MVLTLILQGCEVICPGCNKPITAAQAKQLRGVHRDHGIPLALGGADAPHNCRYMHAHCHALKTDGDKPHTTLGSDKHAIAKVKRLRGETKQRPKKKIKSRPFQTNKDGKFKSTMGMGTKQRQ